jgi:hypothetical protein
MKQFRTAALWVLILPQFVFAQHDPSAHQHHGDSHKTHQVMQGSYGNYAMSRESSGTSWQPEVTPMEGIHITHGEWMFMFHGFASGVYTSQGGRRGHDDVYGPNMFMGMGNRKIGSGTFSARAMLSLEPATIGRNGYPELLQTGETADGRTLLIDRQHPHDLFMELALSYSIPVGDEASAFAYFGLPGEPALGPPTFMHRFSGIDNPEAPISHHWLDSTHITFGVATLGYVWRQFKVDASAFTGREPDEHRWNIERPRIDSYSARLSWNPTKRWAGQVSYGNSHSPEKLHPETDVQRLTASVMYAHDWNEIQCQTMLAWGRNINDPGRTLDALLLESSLRLRGSHTLFGRAESIQKDELFPEGHSNEGKRYLVHKLSLGYIYDFPKWRSLRAGLGGMGSVHFLPHSLKEFYGETPLSLSLFARLKF